MFRPKLAPSSLFDEKNSDPAANDNDSSGVLEPLHRARVGNKAALEIRIKLSSLEVCQSIALLEGVPKTHQELELFIDIFSRRLRSEILAELAKRPFYDPHISVKFSVETVPDIAVSERAKGTINELCLWETPIAAKDLDAFVEKSVARLRPVIKIYQTATDPKLRAH